MKYLSVEDRQVQNKQTKQLIKMATFVRCNYVYFTQWDQRKETKRGLFKDNFCEKKPQSACKSNCQVILKYVFSQLITVYLLFQQQLCYVALDYKKSVQPIIYLRGVTGLNAVWLLQVAESETDDAAADCSTGELLRDESAAKNAILLPPLLSPLSESAQQTQNQRWHIFIIHSINQFFRLS